MSCRPTGAGHGLRPTTRTRGRRRRAATTRSSCSGATSGGDEGSASRAERCTPWVRADEGGRRRLDECVDTDNGAVVRTATTAMIRVYPSWCGGSYDDDDFSSDEMCVVAVACHHGVVDGKLRSTTAPSSNSTAVRASMPSVSPSESRGYVIC